MSSHIPAIQKVHNTKKQTFFKQEIFLTTN